MTELLTTREVQDMLQVDRTTIYRMVESGQLPAIRVGKQWRFARSEMARWLNSQAAVPVASEGKMSLAVGQAGVAAAPMAATSGSASTANLAELLPVACVQMIQDAFADALGVMMVITDMQGQPVTHPSNTCGLYNTVISHADAVARCILHWQSMAGILPLEPRFLPGDLGLLCARGLIRSGNELKGMVFVGGIAPESWPPDEQGIAHIAGLFGLEPAEVAADIESVHRLDKAGRDRAILFVQRIADIVAHILLDRNALYGRLQTIASLTSF